MDISFPVVTLFISDAVEPKHQGISASLVNTVINYSIATGLGIAATLEVELARGDMLKGYRVAMYTSVGLAAAGVAASVAVVVLRRHTGGRPGSHRRTSTEMAECRERNDGSK
jgi:hypothetical protein